MIVLDTHALVWWVTGDAELSANARAAIKKELNGGEIIVSSISAWEIAMLVAREKGLLEIVWVNLRDFRGLAGWT